MTLLGDEFEIDGNKLDPDVTERVNAARLIGRDEGAMSLELTIWDGDGQLMREGKLATVRRPKDPVQAGVVGAVRRVAADPRRHPVPARRVDVRPGQPARPAHLGRRGRGADAPAHRAIVTSAAAQDPSAGTIGLAVDGREGDRDPVPVPEERIKQNIEEPKDDEAEQKGLSRRRTSPSRASRPTASSARTWRPSSRSPTGSAPGERATLALLVACITGIRVAQPHRRRRRLAGRPAGPPLHGGRTSRPGRSSSTPAPAARPRLGHVVATRPARSRPASSTRATSKSRPRVPAPRLLEEGRRDRSPRRTPTWRSGEIAQNVQGSGATSRTAPTTQPWVNEAKAILDAWGGAGQVQTCSARASSSRSAASSTRTTRSPRTTGPARTGSQRGRRLEPVGVAQPGQLHQRRVAVQAQARVHHRPGERVRRSERPADSLAPFVKIGYREDVGSRSPRSRIQAVSRRWDGAPGSTVLLDDLGPISGKWLISENDFDLQRDIATITLRRPCQSSPSRRPTPGPDVRTETRRQETGSPRARILAIAERALQADRGHYHYEQTRPMPQSLFEFPKIASPPAARSSRSTSTAPRSSRSSTRPPTSPTRTASATTVTTSGNTSTLRANGRKTSDPQPGDLAHYGSGAAGNSSHVGVYIGGGKIIQIGGKAGVSELPCTTGRTSPATGPTTSAREALGRHVHRYRRERSDELRRQVGGFDDGDGAFTARGRRASMTAASPSCRPPNDWAAVVETAEGTWLVCCGKPSEEA
jgi:hypothetical protein